MFHSEGNIRRLTSDEVVKEIDQMPSIPTNEAHATANTYDRYGVAKFEDGALTRSCRSRLWSTASPILLTSYCSNCRGSIATLPLERHRSI